MPRRKPAWSARHCEIEKLKVQIARLRRQQFGRSSEKIDRIIEQLELMLDELETEAALGPAAEVSTATADEDEDAPARRKSPGRRPGTSKHPAFSSLCIDTDRRRV